MSRGLSDIAERFMDEAGVILGDPELTEVVELRELAAFVDLLSGVEGDAAKRLDDLEANGTAWVFVELLHYVVALRQALATDDDAERKRIIAEAAEARLDRLRLAATRRP